MKRIYTLVVVLLCSCATPKYNYYFDHVTSTPKNQLAVKEDPAAVTPRLPLVDSRALTASSNPDFRAVESPKEKFAGTANHGKQSITKGADVQNETRLTKKDLRKIRKYETEKTIKKTSADSSKNGWAIAGFITSLVGFLVFWPLCILGVIFSAIGLKSERKGLAIAGLVIGVVGAVIVLLSGSTGVIK